MVFLIKNMELVWDYGKLNEAEHRKILEENLLESWKDFKLGILFSFLEDNNVKHTAAAPTEQSKNVAFLI